MTQIHTAGEPRSQHFAAQVPLHFAGEPLISGRRGRILGGRVRRAGGDNGQQRQQSRGPPRSHHRLSPHRIGIAEFLTPPARRYGSMRPLNEHHVAQPIAAAVVQRQPMPARRNGKIERLVVLVRRRVVLAVLVGQIDRLGQLAVDAQFQGARPARPPAPRRAASRLPACSPGTWADCSAACKRPCSRPLSAQPSATRPSRSTRNSLCTGRATG